MKKTIYLVAVFTLLTQVLFAQQEYMDAIVAKACECVSEIPENEEITGENFGICILAEAAKYGDELLRDYNINMLNIDNEGEELGRIVGLKMMTYCPDQIKRFVQKNGQESETEQETEELYEVITGKVKLVTVGDFVIFSIKDDDGKTSKFYWLTFVKSDYDIQESYDALKGKKVQIEYSIVELFDPKLKEYRNYNMIESLNVLK